MGGVVLTKFTIMKDFKGVYDNGKDQWPSHWICKHCGERVERGVMNVSDHWLSCLQRKDGLIVLKRRSV